MKDWILVIGVLVLVGLAILVFVMNSQPVQAQNQNSETCGSGNCPYASQGGCTAQNNCGRSTCGAVNGGSCGCGS